MNDLKDVKVRPSRFPFSLVGIYLSVFLCLSGLHTGLIVLMWKLRTSTAIMAAIPILYWLAASVGLTFFTRYKMKQVYEKPMQMLAKAAAQVARGDFSIYLAPIHTVDKQDYLDVMICDFNRMVEALGSIETLKTDFLSNVSHEIKTPLAVIQNTAELLNSSNLTVTERKECVDTIRNACRRLSNLITNILKLNKLEKQTISPDIVRYDLPAQLTECALQFEDVWERKAIQFEVDLDDKASVKADPELMALVWTNLLSNAFKFTPAGGAVTLTQRAVGKTIIVEVADTGCGMDEETKNHIFEKFYQGDTSHSTEGSGLGLALVWRVIQMMGARLEVSSSLGKGSIFTVSMEAAVDMMNENGTEREDAYGTVNE